MLRGDAEGGGGAREGSKGAGPPGRATSPPPSRFPKGLHLQGRDNRRVAQTDKPHRPAAASAPSCPGCGAGGRQWQQSQPRGSRPLAGRPPLPPTGRGWGGSLPWKLGAPHPCGRPAGSLATLQSSSPSGCTCHRPGPLGTCAPSGKVNTQPDGGPGPLPRGRPWTSDPRELRPQSNSPGSRPGGPPPFPQLGAPPPRHSACGSLLPDSLRSLEASGLVCQGAGPQQPPKAPWRPRQAEWRRTELRVQPALEVPGARGGAGR